MSNKNYLQCIMWCFNIPIHCEMSNDDQNQANYHTYHLTWMLFCVCVVSVYLYVCLCLCVCWEHKIYLLSKFQVYSTAILIIVPWYTLDLKLFILHNWNIKLFDQHLPIFTIPSPCQRPFFSLLLWVWLFRFHIQIRSCSICLSEFISFSIFSSRVTHIIANGRIFFL